MDDLDSKGHRHVSLANFGTFYIDLDKVDVSLFKTTEIPIKFVTKAKRQIKLNSILDER